MADQTKYTAKLRGANVLVIGGSNGIGYAVAEASVEHGARVTIASSNQERVDAAIKTLKESYPSATDRVHGYTCNLGDEETVEKNIVALLERCGKLDHIVYTAGNSNPAVHISEATLETFKSAGTVRYTAPAFLAKHAPKFLNPGPKSSITLTTGFVTERPIPNWSGIAGPRSAVRGLCQAAALDLRPIRVNAVALGPVDTGLWAKLPPESRDATLAALKNKSATGRLAQPSDVAEAYIYCMKDLNVTGSTIHTNGGRLLL